MCGIVNEMSCEVKDEKVEKVKEEEEEEYS